MSLVPLHSNRGRHWCNSYIQLKETNPILPKSQFFPIVSLDGFLHNAVRSMILAMGVITFEPYNQCQRYMLREVLSVKVLFIVINTMLHFLKCLPIMFRDH